MFGLKRFDNFTKKVSKNGLISKNKFRDNNYITGFCLKADIKHYFEEVDHFTLLNIIQRKMTDKEVIRLIKEILNNNAFNSGGGRKQERNASWESNLSIFC